jgi:hypothetical protein
MTETKVCCKCKKEKNNSEFNKSTRNKSSLRGECKSCQKKYYNQNSEKLKKRRKERYSENTTEELDKNKIYYNKNKKEIINNLRIKRQTDNFFRMKNNLRSRLIQFLSSHNLHKDNKTFEIVGCSPEFLKEYLENKFTEGMSWNKMGESIHIDHIIPLSSAKNEEEVYELCHYTNLQPLWAEDNLRKGNKIL